MNRGPLGTTTHDGPLTIKRRLSKNEHADAQPSKRHADSSLRDSGRMRIVWTGAVGMKDVAELRERTLQIAAEARCNLCRRSIYRMYSSIERWRHHEQSDHVATPSKALHVQRRFHV